MALALMQRRLLLPLCLHQHRFIFVASKNQFASDDDIERKRDVSRMNHSEPTLESILLRPKIRRQQGKLHRYWAFHGSQSGVDPRTIWPSAQKLKEMKALEKRLYPSLQQMLDVVNTAAAEEKAERETRDNTIKEKMEKLKGWMDEFKQRRESKLMEAETQRVEKEKMLEEIRAYLGFRVDPKDERFQQIVEEKERERAKLAKAARKKEKIARDLAKLEAEAKAAQEQRLKGQTDSS